MLSHCAITRSTAQTPLILWINCSPYEIKHVQTDNDLEFNKCFADYLEKKNIVQYYNYHKSPKSNAYVERFMWSLSF
jgi:hypothetical protein